MTIAPSGPVIVITTLDWDPSQTGPSTGTASGGGGTWDTTSYDWYNPVTGTDQAWNPSNTIAAFAGTSGTVTLDTGISADEVSFQSGGYTLTGGSLSAAGRTAASGRRRADGHRSIPRSAAAAAFSKTGAGDLILGGANSYTGQTTIAQWHADARQPRRARRQHRPGLQHGRHTRPRRPDDRLVGADYFSRAASLPIAATPPLRSPARSTSARSSVFRSRSPAPATSRSAAGSPAIRTARSPRPATTRSRSAARKTMSGSPS